MILTRRRRRSITRHDGCNTEWGTTKHNPSVRSHDGHSRRKGELFAAVNSTQSIFYSHIPYAWHWQTSFWWPVFGMARIYWLQCSPPVPLLMFYICILVQEEHLSFSPWFTCILRIYFPGLALLSWIHKYCSCRARLRTTITTATATEKWETVAVSWEAVCTLGRLFIYRSCQRTIYCICGMCKPQKPLEGT